MEVNLLDRDALGAGFIGSVLFRAWRTSVRVCGIANVFFRAFYTRPTAFFTFVAVTFLETWKIDNKIMVTDV